MDPNQENLTLEEKLALRGNFNVEKTYVTNKFKKDHFEPSITSKELKANLIVSQKKMTLKSEKDLCLTREARNVIYVDEQFIYSTGSRNGLFLTDKSNGETNLLEIPVAGFSNGLYMRDLDCFLLYTMGGKIFFFDHKLKEVTETGLKCCTTNDDLCAIKVEEDIIMFPSGPKTVSIFNKITGAFLSKEDRLFEMTLNLGDRVLDCRILDFGHFLVVGN